MWLKNISRDARFAFRFRLGAERLAVLKLILRDVFVLPRRP